MTKINTPIIGLLLIAFLLAGCSATSEQAVEDDSALVFTEVAQTIQSAIVATQTAIAANNTPTPAHTVTLIPSPTSAATPSMTTVPIQYSYAASTVAYSACDMAGFVSDVTIPDGTVMTGGTTFTKTWKLRNDGTCTWTTDYKLTFFSSAQMNGPTTSQLTTVSVAPGETLEISLDLTTPTTNGTYYGYWVLTNASGQNFGIGTAGDPFYVMIVVGSTSTSTLTSEATATATTAETSTSTPTVAPTATSTLAPTIAPDMSETPTTSSGG